MRAHVLWLALLLPLCACGHKGNLKSSAQIELDEQKKAKQQAKEEQKEQKTQEKAAQQQDVPQKDQPYPRTDTGL